MSHLFLTQKENGGNMKIKIIFFGWLFIGSSCLAEESLKEIPSLYVPKEVRQTLEENQDSFVNGYIVLEKVFHAQTFMRPLPPDIDFDKENAIMFLWGGSGQDKIDYDQDEDGVYHFVLKRGMTKDYHSHTKIFVVPKNTEWLFHRVLE
jgi:hypothetical protein